MNLPKYLVPLALLPAALSAQTPIYSTDFSTGALKSTLGNTVNVGDWILASTKATTSSLGSSGSASYATGAFGFGIAATTSGFVEAQSRFTSSPVSLSTQDSYIELKVLFTDTTNLLKGNGGTNALTSTINVGLFDSGGVSPAAGLAAAGLTSTLGNANFGTGFAQNWEGYSARIGTSASASSVINTIQTRPVQNANTASANQDLLFMAVGGGSYGLGGGVGVAGVNVATAASTFTAGNLINGTQYQLTYRITNSGTSSYSIAYTLSDSTGTTQLQTISGTATGSSFINGLTFDGLALGFRDAQSTTGSGTSIPGGISLNSINVAYYDAAAVPEPSTYAALAGLVGLAAVGLRRRRKG